MLELARRPEYTKAVREEIQCLINQGEVKDGLFAYSSARKAKVLDSFIREVMRTKGDILSITRETTTDVSLAGYTIPKGKRSPYTQHEPVFTIMIVISILFLESRTSCLSSD